MIDENFSNIDWRKRMYDVKLDFDKLWQTDKLLADRTPGDSPMEKFLTSILDLDVRENQHETLIIVPIRNANSITESEVSQIVIAKRHMFVSVFWQMATNYYKQHGESLQGFSCERDMEEVRRKIKEVLPNDEDSRKVYDEMLDEASDAHWALTYALSQEILQTLDAANRSAAMLEAKRAYQEGLIEKLNKREELSDERILEIYIQRMMDSLINNKG